MVSATGAVGCDCPPKVTCCDKDDVLPEVLGFHLLYKIFDRGVHLSEFGLQRIHVVRAMSCGSAHRGESVATEHA